MKKKIAIIDYGLGNVLSAQQSFNKVIKEYNLSASTTIKKGFTQCRVDGEIVDISNSTILKRYKNHDIEIVIDKLFLEKEKFSKKRLKDSIETCFFHGNNSILIIEKDSNEGRYFSLNLMCEDSGISYQLPDPNNFSFNSPRGACKKCKGLGRIKEVDIKKIIPDDSISINNGAIDLIKSKKSWIYKQIELISKKFNFSLDDPIKKIPKNGMNAILYGLNDGLKVQNKSIDC